MNDQINQQEVETSEKTPVYTQKRFKKVNFLIFALCLVMAFVFWCYALYLDDPIMEKVVTVNFVLEGGEATDSITPVTRKVTVYGEKSVLSEINTITVKVNRNQFAEYNVDTVITIQYPKNIESVTKQLTLKLISNAEQ